MLFAVFSRFFSGEYLSYIFRIKISHVYECYNMQRVLSTRTLIKLSFWANTSLVSSPEHNWLAPPHHRTITTSHFDHKAFASPKWTLCATIHHHTHIQNVNLYNPIARVFTLIINHNYNTRNPKTVLGDDDDCHKILSHANYTNFTVTIIHASSYNLYTTLPNALLLVSSMIIWRLVAIIANRNVL